MNIVPIGYHMGYWSAFAPPKSFQLVTNIYLNMFMLWERTNYITGYKSDDDLVSFGCKLGLCSTFVLELMLKLG